MSFVPPAASPSREHLLAGAAQSPEPAGASSSSPPVPSAASASCAPAADSSSGATAGRQQRPLLGGSEASAASDAEAPLDLDITSVVDVVPPPFSMYSVPSADPPAKGAKKNKVPFFRLFRFADRKDALLILGGLVCAMGTGVMMPLFTIFMGDMVNAWVAPSGGSSDGSAAAGVTSEAVRAMLDAMSETIDRNVRALLIMGAVSLVTRFFMTFSFTHSARRQADRMRRTYVQAALSQEMGWFDSQRVGELTTRITDVTKIQDGIGEKVGMFALVMTTFVAGWVIGFTKGWKMSLVLLSMVPVLMVVMGVLSRVFRKLVMGSAEFYAKAGQVAEEILSCIRTVTAFGIQQSALQRYDENLVVTRRMGYKKGLSMGTSFGMLFLVLFSAYGLAFWFGSTLVDKGEMSPGDVLIVFFSIMMGAMSVAQVGPLSNAFLEAMGCAYDIFAVIDRRSLIDARSGEGDVFDIEGDIELRNVYFRYPTRPEVEVLRNFSLHIRKGQTVALVGGSGSGKSTIVGLLERFYDIEEGYGTLTVDGRPIRSINLQCLRSQIGIVTQEPVLFATSIARNIAYGIKGEASEDDIVVAAKRANAHNFIMDLPQQYNTLVGERGVQLSGGQKQRIAIARALIRKPKLLVFDEATSALDSESEKVVQAAIDEITKGNTCVIVAHRLSTVRNADVIVALRDGKVEEQGTHDELMAKEGLYYSLVRKQQLKDEAGERTKKAVDKKKSKEGDEDKREMQKIESDIEKETEKASENLRLKLVLRAFGLLKPNGHWVSVAAIAAIVNGAIFPCFALIVSEVVGTLVSISSGSYTQEQKDKIRFWSIGFVLLGVISMTVSFLQFSCIEVSGERLTKYMRYESFKAMLRQEIAYFDDKRHMTGILTTRLATDATLLHGITGNQICQLIQMSASLVAGIVIGFTGSWKLALAVLACVPPQAVASAIHIRFMTKHQQDMKKAYEQSGQVANEALENPRTVATLGREIEFSDDYEAQLAGPAKKGMRATYVHSLGGGVTSLSQMWLPCLAFWYGGKLTREEGLDFTRIMRAQSAIMFGAQAIGQLSAFFPDYGKAFAAAHHLFELFDRKPLISPADGIEPAGPGESDAEAQRRARREREAARDPERPDEVGGLRGEIEFRDVEFFYPTRPGVQVLQGLSFVARPQQTVALVGSSGCGKSTVISMLERMYDPVAGEIFLDGRPLGSLNVSWLRSQIGLVSQEPSLFATSIQENIRYGKPGATLEEVVEAAKMANAHSFISSFPKGYDTAVGEKGVTLSGGQKQRIAIARALIRNPKILLLDEATSALDTNSEAIVQEALDRARSGRTTIVVAHRLSTIVNADCIVVVSKGRVVEVGTHHELMARGGHYFSLASNQMK
eukprot:m51a1_g14273 putative multidrug resistance protein 1 (1370) ;mRNA; r:344850-349837